jgi:VCBS repeat-containing protein
LITYNAVNDNAPVIATLGRFKITEGTSTTLQYVKITQSLLKATDADSGTSNSSLTFNVSSVTGGSFVRLTDTKGNYSPVTSFTQAEMMANKIFFLQSGASVVPTFNVSVSDGSKTSATHSVRFEFTEVNDAPVTSLNAIGLNSGATVVLKKTHLTLKDDEVSDSSLLTFTVTAIKGGSFKKTVDSTATTVKTFTFKDVEDGKISFVHDGSAKASFSLKGSDGELSSSVGQGFFFGIGDAASVSGTKANETFVVTSKTFASIKGGAGNDTLWFGSGVSGDLDLTLPSFDGKIADIEALDLNSAGITLKLNLAEVKALSSSSDAVKIHGEAGNTVIISDLNAWTKGANVTGSTGIEYYRYTNGDATLDIQKEISVSAAPTLSLRTWDLVQNGSFALNGTLLAISDADTASSASLSVSASGLLGGTFRKTGTEGAVSSFTREELEAGQISFLHDGADKVSYTLKVTDNIGLESSSVTRTYEFGIGSGETATGTADANTFVITSQAFTKVDGAAGTDTVRFGAGLTGLFDLTALADTLFKDVEIFELAGTDSILKLNVAEVKALSSTSDRLIVRGSSADEIQIADFASWSKGSDVTRENILYSSYSNAGATLEIQKDISII